MGAIFEKKTIITNPYNDQKPGTSGLRRRVTVFQKKNYLHNFVQSIFNVLKDCDQLPIEENNPTLLVSGDGRYFNKEAIQHICCIAAGNGVKRVLIGEGGLMSTPAASAVIRERESGVCFGGIVLTASHNAGGPEGDFGIKYNIENGSPALDEFTESVFETTKTIKTYEYVNLPKIDFTKNNAIHTFQLEHKKMFQVEVIDYAEDWLNLMKNIFDFDAIRDLFKMEGFSMVYDGMHGVAGAYAKRLFRDVFDAKNVQLQNCEPSESFNGKHPDPNLTYADDLVAVMKPYEKVTESTPVFGAAGDGDNDRNMILGRGFFVTPCDSVAIIAAYAEKCIPYFVSTKLKGVARSMPTSRALDRVAAAHKIMCHEVPTGWKYFGSLMDANLLSICGEESFGTGSDHIREKDGLWAVLAWLSILAYRAKLVNKVVDVKEIVHDFWKEYGRNYYCRYDYEEVDSAAGVKLMDHIRSLKGEDFEVDDFKYIDPVSKAITPNQGLRVIFKNTDRIIFRQSGTGSVGCTVRVYIEKYAAVPSDAAEIEFQTLQTRAVELGKIQQITGRKAPTVIT